MKVRHVLWTAAILAAGGVAATGGQEAAPVQQVVPGKAAPAFERKDLKGSVQSLAAHRGHFVVLEWTNYDCPFVKKHYETGRMQALQKRLAADGVVWLSVCSSAPGKQGHLTPGAWEARMKALGAAPAALLVDADGTLGRLYGARNTPQMAVIDPAGILIYAGAIDDQPGINREIMDQAVNYVARAIEEARAGKPVTTPVTKPYGCSVKY